MPHINPQPEPLPLRIIANVRQLAHGHNIIEPVIILVTSLKHRTQLQATIWLRRPRSLQEDIRAVVGLEVIPRICAEDACLRVCDAPVSAHVEDLACATISSNTFTNGEVRRSCST